MAATKELIAYCWQNGKVEFGSHVPDGALGLAKGRERLLTETVATVATHGYGEGVLLVPGLPTADNNDDRLQAVNDFRDLINERLERYTLPEGVEWDGDVFWCICPDCGHQQGDMGTNMSCEICSAAMPTLDSAEWPSCLYCEAPETPDGDCSAKCALSMEE